MVSVVTVTAITAVIAAGDFAQSISPPVGSRRAVITIQIQAAAQSGRRSGSGLSSRPATSTASAAPSMAPSAYSTSSDHSKWKTADAIAHSLDSRGAHCDHAGEGRLQLIHCALKHASSAAVSTASIS